MSATVDTVSWLTLGAAVLGTIASTFTALWTVARQDREIFDVHIDWEWFGSGPTAELPFVYIHNRSRTSIAVVELAWLSGAIFRYQSSHTALYNEGPADVGFPYDIKPGDSKKLFLDEDGAVRAMRKARTRANLYGALRRSSVWLRVTTMRGKKSTVGAERALPWVERPRWVTGENEDRK